MTEYDADGYGPEVRIVNPDTGREVFPKSTVRLYDPARPDGGQPQDDSALVAITPSFRGLVHDLGTYPAEWVRPVDEGDADWTPTSCAGGCSRRSRRSRSR